MDRIRKYTILGIVLLAAGLLLVYVVRPFEPVVRVEQILSGYQEDFEYPSLAITYPLDETLFPPDIVGPTFRWEDGNVESNAWLLRFDFDDAGLSESFLSRSREWTPSEEEWQAIKQRSLQGKATVTVLGVNDSNPETILSAAGISIATSGDEVGAPLFFREVNLPFLTAVTDPAKHIRWRFGPISSTQPPPIVLEKLPVCGNCHSFSADGSTLAMEVDSGNDKGSYAIAPVEEEIVLDKSKIITWSDYKRQDNEKTFGLLCQASPDGRHIVGTVKDRALAVYTEQLAFSQLFFLVKGILAIHDREQGTFAALPGADDSRYVQTNATWSPDGKYLVFARSRDEAYDPQGVEHLKSVLVPREAAEEFLSGGRKFRYDLYRIPFNGGRGGKAEPIEGASNNGMSNYFAKYSPDGKWIVFCKADSFMLLQPDSQLYIIPAEGGEARRLRCNQDRMNSWHSWSPNGKWLVFSSKANSVYTQLFLTHIDERGRSSPAVVLSHLTAENRAANIPEFVNASPLAIKQIRQEFLDDVSFLRAGVEAMRGGDFDAAERAYRTALQFNPANIEAGCELGVALMEKGMLVEAEEQFRKLLDLKPDLYEGQSNLGNVLVQQKRHREALGPLREALRLRPGEAAMHVLLGQALMAGGQGGEGRRHFDQALRLNPDYAAAYRDLDLGIDALAAEKTAEALEYFKQALASRQDLIPVLLATASILATAEDDDLRQGVEAVRLAERACKLSRYSDPTALAVLASAYAENGQFGDALHVAQRAVQFAELENQNDLAAVLKQALKLYQEGKPCRRPQFPWKSP